MAEPQVAGARLVASAADVRRAWDRLATALQPLVHREPCLLLGVMLGGMVPLVQIASRLEGDYLIDYCHLSRYHGHTVGGDVHWLAHPHQDIRGLTVILVDDIFDRGRTLDELHQWCKAGGAKRVLTAVLVRKRHSDELCGQPDFWGIEVGNEYVFGCGMDYRERWRHLNEIYALSQSEPSDFMPPKNS